jgi:hypothetical protein
VSRIGRVTTAIVLVLGCGAAPLATDWCAASCEAARSAATAAAASCHHSASPVARIGHPSTPCGHEHQGVVVVVAADPQTSSRVSIATSAPAVALHAPLVRPIGMTRYRGREVMLSNRSIPLALSSTLRI